MFLKNTTVLEVKVGDRSYEFHCAPDSPLGEIHDSLSQMKSYIVDRINDSLDKENVTSKVEES